tara:strand:+ start:631 stop:843 length:213 start_codon:yes stop_codon:yes gene_type:complete
MKQYREDNLPEDEGPLWDAEEVINHLADTGILFDAMERVPELRENIQIMGLDEKDLFSRCHKAICKVNEL